MSADVTKRRELTAGEREQMYKLWFDGPYTDPVDFALAVMLAVQVQMVALLDDEVKHSAYAAQLQSTLRAQRYDNLEVK